MKHRGRDFWERHVLGLKASGQTRQAYCAAQGLNRHTLDSWRRRMADEQNAVTEAALAFVPIVAKPPAKPDALELCWPSGVRLRFPAGCDVQWLSQMLAGLH